MTYDEIKALLEKLEKFRQVVQSCAAEGNLMATVDSQDHLLREAILCIEDLDQKLRMQEPMRYYCSTGGRGLLGIADKIFNNDIQNYQQYILDANEAMKQYGPFPKFGGDVTSYAYKQEASSFKELAAKAETARLLRLGMPDWKKVLYRGAPDPCLD